MENLVRFYPEIGVKSVKIPVSLDDLGKVELFIDTKYYCFDFSLRKQDIFGTTDYFPLLDYDLIPLGHIEGADVYLYSSSIGELLKDVSKDRRRLQFKDPPAVFQLIWVEGVMLYFVYEWS